MPRISRGVFAGQIYHVLNRGNNKAQVFHKPEDYVLFMQLVARAGEIAKVRLFCYCLMPNHFHLVVSPEEDGSLSAWMQWLMTSHVRRYHAHYGTVGHIWQGRFKSFLIKTDDHLLTVARYVEANPLRAALVASASDWEWSSYRETAGAVPRRFTARLPIEIPGDWKGYLNSPMTLHELEKVRVSVARQAPFGDPAWQLSVSGQFGLDSTLHPRGRPKKNGYV